MGGVSVTGVLTWRIARWVAKQERRLERLEKDLCSKRSEEK